MMTSEFQGKVALVTGASSGIGSAVAMRLGRRWRNGCGPLQQSQENAAAVASAIMSAGGTAFIVGGDVAKVDDASNASSASRGRSLR